jgi:hypothetical protein
VGTRISATARSAACDGVVDRVDTGTTTTSKLQLRTGTRPTNLTDAATGTLLAEFALPNPCFGAAATGVATANAISNVSGLAAGTVGYFRVIDRDGTIVMDSDSVGTSGTELVLNTTTISIGVTVSVTSWTATMPAGS